MCTRSFVLVGLVIVFCLPFSAVAQDKNPNYFVLKGGIYSPQTNDLSGFNTGFNGEIAFGHYFAKNLAGEGSIGYFHSSASQNDDISGIPVSERVKIDVMPVTVALKGSIPVEDLEFYGLGGIGAYFVWTEVDVSSATASASPSDTDAVFGGFLGLGVNYNVTPNVFLGVEGKYLWTTKAKFRDTAFGAPLNADYHLDGIQATFNIGYRF
ncbi:MAG TPA: outer membrane beta-barrel protein [Syntrophorhabdaceae bacterium]|nr:outer membrane beta-barrel protein [Syntrophorhabdaceae bacterium]